MRLSRLIPALAALLFSATLVAADAPQPRAAIDTDRFVGRWYEIARTPNRNQPTCTRLQIDVRQTEPGRFSVVNTCAREGRDPRVQRVTARVIEGTNNAKMRFQVGPISQEFWILDRANDYSWAILGTPGGNYFWLWTRQASPSNRAQLLARVRALGYNTSNAVQTGN